MQGVSEPSFYSWRRELARRAAERVKPTSTEPAPARFVELELPEAPSKSPAAAALATASAPASAGAALRIVVGDVRVEVAPGFDGPTLRQLLNVLRSMTVDGAAPC